MRSARHPFVLFLAACSAALAEPANRPVEKNPAIEPLSPEESMKRLKVAPGFRIELVASEPQIREPVALTWDGNGRMFVVEMRGYMQDIEGTGAREPVGRISFLEDTNRDGRMDKHSVYLDGLVEPRAILAVDDGLLVGEPPDLWYCRDTNGDGKADTKELVFDKFSLRGSNVEHKANSLVWGIDNWIHVSQHGRRYQVIKRKVRNERVPTVGQWGLARNDEGCFLFSTNGNPAIGLFVPPRYLGGEAHKDARRGPMSEAVRRMGDYHSVWPAMVTPDLQSGPGTARPSDGSLRHFTAACGQSFFRGDRLGDGINGDYFICEPVGRLVRRSKVKYPDSGHVELTNMYENDLGEFISSTDGNFRPVNSYTGPDGCLYIVDMYHGIIQERGFITPYLRGEILKAEYEKNIGRGRIYRVVCEGVRPGPKPNLLDAKPAELVKHLAHPNGWWRDMAQSILVTRGVQTLDPALREMALKHENPLGRLHALWTLDGLGQLDDETAFALTKDMDHRVRAAAVRTMEHAHLNQIPVAHYKQLDGLIGDPSPLVVAQIVLTVGQGDNEEGRNIIAKCIAKHPVHEKVLRAVAAVTPRERLVDSAQQAPSLSGEERAIFEKGKAIYRELCTTCHGPDGRGMKAPEGKALLAPPLPGSPRLQQNREAAIQVMLHGLIGDLDGKKYEGLMAPFGANNKDEWVASVLTYVRREWGNAGSTILPSDVAFVRERFKDRKKPWTQAELNWKLLGKKP